jgi:hypothetical protein
MVAFGLVAPASASIAPQPAQKILDLLLSYGIVYPGNAVPAPTFELITLAEKAECETAEFAITKFITEIFPKLQPNSYTPVAFTAVDSDNVDPAINSGIYNFYSVTNNKNSDIVPPGAAKPLNAALTELETIYNPYALSFIMNLFYQHMNDITDNPHHDSTLDNVWNDFFGALYLKYTQLVQDAAPLAEFISTKTVGLDIATLLNYTDPSSANFLVTLTVMNALLAAHNTSTSTSTHSTLQTYFQAETQLPEPRMYITPELFMGFFTVLSPTETLYLVEELEPIQKINYFITNVYSTISGPSGQSAATQIGEPGYIDYYNTGSLGDMWPRMNGTIYMEFILDLNSTATVNVLEISSSVTTDSLLVQKNGQETGQFHIIINFGGVIYDNVVPAASNSIVFAFVYTTSGLAVTYLDGNGNQQVGSELIQNFTLDFDIIQLGIPVSYPYNTAETNCIQKLAVYPRPLTSDQISLLLGTILS